MGRKFCHYRTRDCDCAVPWNVTCAACTGGYFEKLTHKLSLGKGLQSFEKIVQKGEDLIPNTRILDSSDIVTKTI
jgi:hypothetical protein